MPDTPTLGRIRRYNGVAGQFSYTVEVTFGDEPMEVHTFVGSVYGSPIVAISPAGTQVFVSQRVTDRIGTTLNPAWIRAFYAPREDAP
jgi:hypothetical protein